MFDAPRVADLVDRRALGGLDRAQPRAQPHGRAAAVVARRRTAARADAEPREDDAVRLGARERRRREPELSRDRSEAKEERRGCSPAKK